MERESLISIRIGERCPGCGVVAHPDSEHLNDCIFLGKLTLVRRDWRRDMGATRFPYRP